MKNRFFASHAKSSAAVVSLAIHAVFVLVAITFVAVKVIQKDDQNFEAKPIVRPKMQLKKLQVPVTVKKKRPKPKLRKRIVVKTKMNQKMPDIKLPEITGVKGGLGNSSGDGLGGADGIGFSMPEIKLFGVKSRGEKVFIVLNSSPYMMVDEIGGIPAYTLIKSELNRILGELNPTVLFNVAVFERDHVTCFPDMVSATDENVAKVAAWLAPLNAVKTGMGDRDYGTRTLGRGGTVLHEDLSVEPLLSSPGEWVRSTMAAMKQQADVVFVLSCRWGHIATQIEAAADWGPEKLARWRQAVARSNVMLREENEKRRGRGEAPRVIGGGDRGLVRAYMPNEPQPPHPRFHHYSPEELAEAFHKIREKWNPQTAVVRSGVKKRKKERYTINYIYFARTDKGVDERDKGLITRLTKLARGEFRSVKGMDAIQSYAQSNE